MYSVFVHGLAVTLLMSVMCAHSEEGRRVPIVAGAVPVDQVTDAPYQGALREGLRQLGYVSDTLMERTSSLSLDMRMGIKLSCAQ
jgi:hypothetical protein